MEVLGGLEQLSTLSQPDRLDGALALCPTGLAHLAWQVWLLVARQDLEDDAATGTAQQLLQGTRVAAHWLPVGLLDDVAHVQQALLRHHAPMQDACDDQLTALYSEGDALGWDRRW